MSNYSLDRVEEFVKKLLDSRPAKPDNGIPEKTVENVKNMTCHSILNYILVLKEVDDEAYELQ